MLTIFVSALLVVGSFAASTAPPPDGHMNHGHMGPDHMSPDHMNPDGHMGPDPHHGHHQPQNGQVQGETFMLDSRTNTLMSRTGGKCYLYKLSDAEISDEHSASHLHMLERKITDMIDGGKSFTAYTQEEVHKLDGMVHHFCHHDTIYNLNQMN